LWELRNFVIGHRNSVVIDLNEHGSIEHQGNFKEIITFRINSGDNDFKNHLKTTKKMPPI